MTDARGDTTIAWSEPLFHAISELEHLLYSNGSALHSQSVEDCRHLLESARALRGLLDRQHGETSPHELMNTLTAVQGYAEMMREDLDGDNPAVLDSVCRVLDATARATEGQPRQHGADGLVSVSSEPGRILAVDDREENRDLIARYLSRNGHTVITAASGREALRALAGEHIDAVLLDLIMPGMDGHEVLHQMKQHEAWRGIPVIVISGRQDMEGIVACISAGADDYLFKPFNPVLLQARIKAGIERKRWLDREQLYREQLERNEKFIRATFGRYLSDEIVADILETPEGLELGGQLREVTIMMSDLRGFTTICEQLPPDQVVALLNRYLGAMTDIILDYQGTIDEFLGDAILAVFGAPRSHNDDPDRAVRCALDMFAAMKDINARNRADGLPEIHAGMALNTGQVIAGNIGSHRRSKYGFVGHPMNLTSRIEEVAGPDELLISDSTWQALTGRYRFGEPRTLHARGIEDSVTVHPVLGRLT